VLAGAIDVASERVETPEEVAATIRAVLEHTPVDRVHPCTNCGMVPLPRGVARAKMSALAAGTAIARHELGEHI
jgi:5-methyltetrahydropteroyltriglutamate--homocysteine methyltransferase